MKKPSNKPTETTVPAITDSTVIKNTKDEINLSLSPTDQKKINMIKKDIEHMNGQIELIEQMFQMTKGHKNTNLLGDTFQLAGKLLQEIGDKCRQYNKRNKKILPVIKPLLDECLQKAEKCKEKYRLHDYNKMQNLLLSVFGIGGKNEKE